MSLPIDLNFEYEKPNATRRGKMRTPASIYLAKANGSGGILFISQDWLDSNGINGNEIAMQVRDAENTFIIFYPPKNAPRFQRRAESPKKNTVAYSCTDSVRKMLDAFGYSDKTGAELWLEKVGTFKESTVCRLRKIQSDDILYQF
jgi:hypothetical protein